MPRGPGSRRAGGRRSRPQPCRADGRPAILDLSLTQTHRFRPFEVVAPGFVHESPTAVGPVAGLVRGETSPQAPFAAVEVEVLDLDGVLAAGLTGPDGELVLATYDSTRGVAAVEVRGEGRPRVVRRRSIWLPRELTFAFVVCENQVTVLARTAAGRWRPLVTERARVAARLDLRRPQTLSRMAYTWGVRSGRATLGDVRAGLFGMTGLRDPHLVQHADGSPVVRDGKAYLTWTCAGLGFFQQAHWGVFALDLDDPTRLDQVAQLYSSRDGMVLGDHAGQLVRDGDHWLVATSSWGDFERGRRGRPVHTRYLATTADLLHGVHLLQTRRLDLPTEVGAWDPGMTRIDGRWHVSFVESPSQAPFDFHPALAVTDDPVPWEGLRLAGTAADLHKCEGPVIARVADRWWLLASDGDARHYPVFDLAMHRVGRLDAPYPTNIPHPQLLPRGDGSWLMVTFDGTPFARRTMGYGGHGDVVVMTGARPQQRSSSAGGPAADARRSPSGNTLGDGSSRAPA